MGYLGRVASDFRESIVSPRKLYKSLGDSPSHTDRGYRFAYNLGTVSAVTGADTKALRSGIYEGLQRSRDVNALKQSQGKFKSESVIRRLVYQFGSRIVGTAVSYAMPVGLGGIGGRYARVVSGRFTSLRLKRMESKAKQVFLGDFQLDAKKVDSAVKKAARQNQIGLDKVVKAIQAIAISDAPDYYALQRASLKDDGLSYKDEGVMAAISFQNYGMEDIDAMLSNDDILNIMGANALRDTREVYSVLSAHGTTADGATIMKPTQFSDRSAANEFAKKNNSSVIPLSISHDEILQEFKTMSGATYAFGDISTATQNDLVTWASNILNSEILREAEDHVAIGSIAAGHRSVKERLPGVARKILDQYYEKGMNPAEVGSVANASRYLRGDMTELYGKPTFRRVETGKKTFTRNFIDELHDDGTVTRHYPADIQKNIVEQVRKTIPIEAEYLLGLESANDLTAEQAMNARFYANDPAYKHIYEQKRKTQRYTVGSRAVTSNKIVGRTTEKGNFGKFTETQFKKVKGQNKTYEHHNKLHTSQSSDNPQRHNFIPNRRQIQAAIHVQDPEFDKEATVEINVAFGGRTPNSKTNDFIRDAFQIEMGGPGTDRGGKLLNRSDMFVYTPSLLMYNAGLKAATAFGLNMSAKKPVGSIGSEQMKQFGMRLSGSDGQALLHGSTYKSSGRQDKIMQELFAKSRKDRLGNPIIDNGRLRLDKSQILRSSVSSSELEILSDTIDDALFGGAYLTKNVFNRKAFEPIATGNPAIDIKKAQQAARQQSDFKFTGPGNAPNEFADLYEYNIGSRTLDEPDLSLYDAKQIVDSRGQISYEITGYKTQYGRSVGYGTARQQGVVSSDTADLAGGNPYDDLRLLRDQDPSSPNFMDQVGIAKITRQLQSERINFNIQEQIRTRLRARQKELGLDNVQIEMLSYKINQRMVKNYLAQAGAGNSALSAGELAILIEFQLTYVDRISDSIRKFGIYSHRFNNPKGRGQKKTQKITSGTREEAIMDAEFNTQAGAIFFDMDGFAEAMAPDEINKLVQMVENGDMDAQTMFYKAKEELQKSSNSFISNLQKQDDTGRVINGAEIRGKKPKATPGTHYGSNKPERFGGTTNFNSREQAKKDVSNYSLTTGNFRNQKKYVNRQIALAANKNMGGALQFILDKVSFDPHVRRAFHAVIRAEVYNNSPRAITNQDIRDYIVNKTGSSIKHNADIDKVIDDLTQEDPSTFEDPIGY